MKMPLYIETFEQDHHPSLQKPTPAQIRQRKKRRRVYATVLIVAGLLLAAGEAFATPGDNDKTEQDRPDKPDRPDPPQRSDPSREGGKTCDDYVSLQKVPRWCLRKVTPRQVTNQDVGSKR